MKAHLSLSFVLILLALSACGEGNDPAATPTPGVVTIQQGSTRATVQIEIAATFAARQQGLMLRQDLSEDAGMLFVFPADVHYGFWMKNTYIPLDIAYISLSGEVLEVRAAKPLDETILTPALPYRYVLEVNQGWFERHRLAPGAIVTLPPNLPPAE